MEQYRDTAAKRAQILADAQSILQAEHDPYLQQRAALAINAYQQDLHLQTYYQEGIAGYIERCVFFGRNSYTQYIMILTVCFLCAGAFSAEHECNIYGMIYASKKGRTQLFAAKQIACNAVIVLLFVLTQCIGFSVYAIRYCGMHGFRSSLQTISVRLSDFTLCPFHVNNLQFLLIAAGMQLLFLLLIVQVALLLSVVTKHTMPSFVGAVLCAVCSTEGFYACKNIQNTEWMANFEKMQMFLPSALLFPECYFTRMNIVRVGDIPMYRLHILLIFCVVLWLILILLTYLSYLHHGTVSRPKRRTLKHGIEVGASF